MNCPLRCYRKQQRLQQATSRYAEMTGTAARAVHGQDHCCLTMAILPKVAVSPPPAIANDEHGKCLQQRQ
jgi:hypothetical protein